MELHPRLAADTGAIGETRDFWLRWMNDQRFPWVIVIPRCEGVLALHELEPGFQHVLMEGVNGCASCLEEITGADRINIGMLGNQVPQLHVHVVARFRDDACWPGPVWGNGTPRPYNEGELPSWLQGLREGISDLFR